MDPWSRIETLASALLRGETGAWAQLWVALEPELRRMWRFAPIGRLRDREDDRANAMVYFFDKLRADDHRVLRRYFDASDRPPLKPWMRTVFVRTAIDYMRSHEEFQRRATPADHERQQRSQHRWIELMSLTSNVDGGAYSLSRRVLALRLLERLDAAAAEAKPEQAQRRALYRPALEHWLTGATMAEIAQALALSSSDEADQIVNAAKELLRRWAAES